MFLVGIFDVLLGICAEYHKLIDYYVLKPKKKSDFDGKVTFFVPVWNGWKADDGQYIKKRNSWPFSFHQKVWNKAFKNP